MSELGDLIVEHGPFVAGGEMPFPTAPNGHPIITAADANALRDELIELRQLAAIAMPAPEACSVEAWSWRHFTAEQADGYWIRCTLAGPHDEHKDAHTGLTWRRE